MEENKLSVGEALKILVFVCSLVQSVDPRVDWFGNCLGYCGLLYIFGPLLFFCQAHDPLFKNCLWPVSFLTALGFHLNHHLGYIYTNKTK